MKNYVEPIVNLLYLENEDVLTTSDPCADDPYYEEETDAEGGAEE